MIVFFAGCELDQARFELRRGGERVSLEPQAFMVLEYLIEHRDRVVSKEELMDKIWGGRLSVTASARGRGLVSTSPKYPRRMVWSKAPGLAWPSRLPLRHNRENSG